MKKFFAAAILSSVMMVNAAFAGNHNDDIITVSYQVANAFKQEFANTKDVSWTKTDNYYKAAFKVNNQPVNAYFTPEGQFIGIIHHLVSSQLPINLQTSLKKNYEDYWISELFEFAQPDSNGYFITVENADQVITLQSSDNSSWSVYSKTKKP